MGPPARPRRTGLEAAAAYTVLAIVMTWPLARGLGRDVAWDLGDSLLNMWILAWDGEQLRALLGGDFGRLATFFDANIFHPAPLALAYSEHLVAQAVQVLPIYLATKNPILCYNLLFLSTFVLSGVGCFLLVRELTGSARAGFVAGVLFAFAPYRFAQAPHLQVLSAQWMPFALYAFRRYFETGHRRALTGAAAALLAQNLSCGYFMLYFTPIALAYVAWEMATRKLWRNPRTWAELGIAAVSVAAITLPFLLPYKQVRDAFGFTRDIGEVIRYSADVYSYLTAFEGSRTWGGVMRAFPKAEGDLFPGAIPLVLAFAAAAAWTARAARTPVEAPPSRVPRAAIALLAAVAGVYATLAVAAIFLRRIDISAAGVTMRATDVTRLLLGLLAPTIALLVLTPRLRARLAAAARQPELIFLVILGLACWLSLGPSPRVLGRSLEIWSPYRLLYDVVPGFEGVRAPSRFAMIVALALAVLGGLAVRPLVSTRAGTAIAAVLMALFLYEARVTPFLVNGRSAPTEYAALEPRVHRPGRAPAVYREIARLPREAVVLELPLGDPDYDVRAVYYSTAHWRRLVNGYSGFFPPHYSRLSAALSAATRGDDLAWEALHAVGVSHVVVHEGAYLDDEGQRLSEWLRGRGARELFRDGREVLFALPAPSS